MDRPNLNLQDIASNNSYDFIKNFTDEQEGDDPFNNRFDSPYDICNFSCNYVDPVDLRFNQSNNKNLSILTLNIQSISAKFNELVDLINVLSKNCCSPDIICLQELWQFPSSAVFSLPGYSDLTYKLRGGGVQGGGSASSSKAILNLKS